MVHRASIAVFLRTAKQHLVSSMAEAKPVTFVVGNESADVDSICGAITYAYTRTYSTFPPSYHIPLTNIPRADIALRTELAPVLQKAEIQNEDLITLSDLPDISERSAQLPASRTRWILVDHNALTGSLAQDYSGAIVGCVDHHDEEHKTPLDCGSEPRVIERSGSCTSLIIEECLRRKIWDSDSKELAWLALGPILIDTQALTSAHKVTDHDIKAAESLESILTSANVQYDRRKYYDDIHNAKEDIGHLSIYDILRKDYKQWDESAVSRGKMDIGISSTVKPLPFLIDKAGGVDKFIEVVESFSAERDLSLVSIMTSYTSEAGEYSRELFVLARDRMGTEALKRFEEGNRVGLRLVETGFGLDSEGKDDKGFCRAWYQKATESSRKQVAPLLRLSAVEGVDQAKM